MNGQKLTLCVVLCSAFVAIANAKPTIYQVNENDKLEPVLIPVSSTVIPLAVYRVELGINVSDRSKSGKLNKPEEPIKLITALNKKKVDPSTIKQITKDEFNKQP